jgi:hypothetical protein
LWFTSRDWPQRAIISMAVPPREYVNTVIICNLFFLVKNEKMNITNTPMTCTTLKLRAKSLCACHSQCLL